MMILSLRMEHWKLCSILKDKIRAISVQDFPFRAKRPKDMSLNCGKTERYLGIRMPGVKEGLNRLHRLGIEGHRAALEKAIRKGLSSHAPA